MKLGDKIWLFDDNRRVYVDDEGNKHQSPIYRKKFVPFYIVGETRVSWIVSNYTLDEIPEWAVAKGKKVKKVEANKTYWTSKEEVENKCWINENIYRIVEKVRHCKDYSLLKQIDNLIK